MSAMCLERVPDVALEHIFQYLSYDEIARCRILSTRFNALCKSLLNKGFRAVEKYHNKCLKVPVPSLADPLNFGIDPDPRIHTSETN
jgi:hypothetical protein